MIKDKDNVTLEDVLQPGTNMLAAGYCMYGSSCTVIESSKPVFPQHNLLLSVPIWNWLAQLICGSLFWALGVVSMASHLTHHLASSYWLIQTSRLIWVTDCGSIIFCLMVQAILMTVAFILHSVQIPKKGKIYSVNEGNAKNWDAAVAKYVLFMCS